MRRTRRIRFAVPARLFVSSTDSIGARVPKVVASVPSASRHRHLSFETVTDNGTSDSKRRKLRRHDRAVAPLVPGLGPQWANNLTWPADEKRRGIGTASRGQLNRNMTSHRDSRHWATTLRNKAVIAAELRKWLEGADAGGGGAGAAAGGSVLEIASGTGCHVEEFAKSLPTWTFKPTEVRFL